MQMGGKGVQVLEGLGIYIYIYQYLCQVVCGVQAGLIEEMLEDTFEGLEDDDLEEAADSEVEKVLFELTKGERLHFTLLALELSLK